MIGHHLTRFGNGLIVPTHGVMTFRALARIMVIRPILKVARDAVGNALVVEIPTTPAIGIMAGRALVRVVPRGCSTGVA